ncbi:probable E3 ubiquitin-protein ligase TRIML2 isoform X1 [Camelus ferus]|uniref:E3 ubiquitin-protein ligase TRIML2 n=2 Tax=Camelus TaxID=9836 RepID=A0A9W3EMK9_CAMBA|nr:probable E3 ubiquitin-protein ligase TRIML2 [Camelus bactrianus]XP_014420306.1 probable E3 ubiquitin-protein ligase TRIML2 [Camelus ferus]XP_032324331.1 probable E3 ubiquitin-protein ligase TRIML2 isoform X1 [Camelus ferus]
MSKRLPSQLEQKIPEDACCEKHLEPPQLFCGDDQMMLCDKYFQSQEHKNHTVYGLQETAENYRKLFQEILTTLKEKLEVAKSMLADEQERMVMMQEEEQNFKEMIESEYRISFQLMIEENMVNLQGLQRYVFNLNLREANQNQPMQFATELREKFQEILQRLNNLGRENMSKLKESEVRLSEHTCSLQKTIAELEKKCGQSTSVLLQNARYALERSESLLLQCLEPAQITDLNLCQITGMSKMLKVLQRPITLDHRTAHPCLVLSEDLRSVRLRNVQQDMSGHPERFDFSAAVLGVESFTSGRHYWEVDVEKATQWQLGIYGGFAYRNDSRDKVLLTGTMMGTDYIFWTFPPLRRVSLRERVHSVGVFLNYEYGQVSFYDVTNRSLIYNFSGLTFQGALRPIFSLCVPNGRMNSDSLSICLPHVSFCNGTVSPQSSLV